MKRILLTTTMAVGLGLGFAPAFAQDQQPSGAETACQPGAPNCPGGESPGASGQTTDGQAGAATQPPKADSQAGDATQPKTDEQAGDATKPKTDEQAGDATQPKTEGQAGDATKPKTEEQAEAPAAKPDSETTASIGDVNVTVEQKTEIRQVISEVHAEPVRVDDIDVDISVGVAVPRTIHVQPLPHRIVEIVPAFEGYVFFVLADGRIIILQPDTYEIVYVLVV
jgi:hypothetical protein